MEHLFLPYELAKQLKELGFNEPCLGWLAPDGYLSIGIREVKNTNCAPDHCAAILYQQAFEWFRTEKKFRSFRDSRLADIDKPNEFVYDFQIKRGNGLDTHPYFSGDFDTMREAEIGCIKSMIKLAKENKI